MKAKSKSKKVAPKKVTKLVIDREKWLRGHNSENSCLLADSPELEKGKMCCLGFLAREFGLTPKLIRENGTPEEVVSKLWPDWCVTNPGVQVETHNEQLNTEWVGWAIDINDGRFTELVREKKLIEHFAKQGIKLSFVG